MAKRTHEEQLALERQAKDELKRIKRRVRDIRKRGYTVPENIIPKLPKKIEPETITHFKKYTPKYIYKRSVYTSPEGVTIKGEQRLKQEYSERAKRAAKTRADKIQQDYYDRQWNKLTEGIIENRPELAETPSDDLYVILDNVYKDFESWQPSYWWSDELKAYKQRDRDRGWGILQGAIDSLGKETVARNVNANAVEVIELENKILYESGNEYREDSRSGAINLALNRFQAILYGRPLSIRDSIKYTSEAEANETTGI